LETRDTAGWKPAPRGEPGMVGRRRKQEGAVYTPAFITRYLVEQALCGVLNPRFETLRRRHEADAARTARFFGTIQTCNLVVEAGAVIVGTVRIGRPGSGPDTATSGSP